MSKLHIYDSITGQKEAFPSLDQIKCYICGPTVYDHAHLGHARTYLTFDIIRRILEEFFGCNMFLVMNITDIDDKIINKVTASEGKSDFSDLSKSNPYINYARQFEQQFFEDMKALRIDPPTVVTRVTEYTTKIIQYIEKIIENGFAYVSNKSVYFDSTKFIEAGYNFMPLHTAEKEDEPQEKEEKTEKKNDKDFALWKATKPGEPFYNSKWGPGRVGWHIECTTMASDIFGESFDIHAGGIDLKFPHHNNEIVQAQAHNKTDKPWAKIFMHMGHLNIAGLKMSKSLKNFISIKDFLKTHTPDQLRLLFIMHKWNKPLDYTDETMGYTLETEKYIVNFFRTVDALTRKEADCKFDIEYLKFYQKTCTSVREALRDDLNTPLVITHLLGLMKVTYTYMEKEFSLSLVNKSVTYIKKILLMFGLSFKTEIKNQKTAQVIDALVDFRDEVRVWAKDHGKKIDKLIMKELFIITDNVRDDKLTKLGIQLEDKGVKKTVWKMIDI